MASMKAILNNKSVLTWGDTEKPVPKDDEILIKVKATAVNRADLLQRVGKYPPPKGASDILGLECSGVIEFVGNSAANSEHQWKVGDKVCALLPGGGYATYCVCHHGSAMRIPKSMSFIDAAGICETYLTAFQNIFFEGNLEKNQNVLIHAGASGVGTSAIQLCRSYPSKNVITTSSSGKTKICMGLGASIAISYETDKEWDKTIIKALQSSGGEGISVILDPIVGSGYLEKNCNVLADDGVIMIIAMMGGSQLEKFNLLPLFKHRAKLQFSTLRARPVDYKSRLVSRFEKEFLSKFETGELKVVVDEVFDIRNIDDALKKCEQNKNIGKIILKVDNE